VPGSAAAWFSTWGAPGAKVVVADLKPDLVEETVAELEAEDVACVGVVCDVKSRESIYSTVDQTLSASAALTGRLTMP
jgi:hypothetical protein